MFRSSFELMITGALAARKQGQSRGVWRLLSVEGQEEVGKEVDRNVRSRLNGQDRMERCRDAGWRYSSREGDLRLWGYRAVPVRPLVGRGVLAKTTPGLRGWEGERLMSTAKWRAFPISRKAAQNIREGDCCRSGRGGWDGMAKVWPGCTSLVPLVVPGRGRAHVARDGGSGMEPVAGSKHWRTKTGKRAPHRTVPSGWA